MGFAVDKVELREIFFLVSVLLVTIIPPVLQIHININIILILRYSCRILRTFERNNVISGIREHLTDMGDCRTLRKI